MTFLLTERPNWLIPTFRQQIETEPVSVKIQYKRFPSDYMWRDFLDLTPFITNITDINTQIQDILNTLNNMQVQIDETEGIAIDAYDLAIIAGDIANAALTDAANAQVSADTANNTADDALALATAGGGGRRATMWADEFHYTAGTPVLLHSSTYRYNFIRYTDTLNAKFTTSFVSGALNDGGLYFLCTKSANSGIITAKIDGTTVGSADLYSATTLNNELALIGFGFSNPTFPAGYHKLEVETTGKFASSSGYAASITKIYVRTNAD